jgi:hypothetical protein
MLRNVDGRPLGGAKARDPIASTINVRKHRRWAPWEVPKLMIQERPPPTLRNVDDGLELEIRKCPPSMLENVNGGPPGRCRS